MNFNIFQIIVVLVSLIGIASVIGAPVSQAPNANDGSPTGEVSNQGDPYGQRGLFNYKGQPGPSPGYVPFSSGGQPGPPPGYVSLSSGGQPGPPPGYVPFSSGGQPGPPPGYVPFVY
ncbi:cuticle collagen 7-like [Panonychus citri]|uniref:cuticle collagen 7-like n=1 Tax=Panonychus citri TaxID=50023 RepID=UPI0023080F6E|nr:cuticle collagen 7-like [Panonychus citri]